MDKLQRTALLVFILTLSVGVVVNFDKINDGYECKASSGWVDCSKKFNEGNPGFLAAFAYTEEEKLVSQGEMSKSDMSVRKITDFGNFFEHLRVWILAAVVSGLAILGYRWILNAK